MDNEKKIIKQKQQLYLQVAEKVKEIIENRGLQAHDPVPSEGELAKLFKVSRMTSKLALEQLMKQGLVYRLPRRGTFLSPNEHSIPPKSNQVSQVIVSEKKAIQHIALIVPHMSDYTSRIISAVEKEIRRHNYELILKICRTQEEQDQCLQSLVNIGISGIILFPIGSKTCSDQVLRLKMEKIPNVIIDRIFREIQIDCVYHDHYQGSYEMAQYLINKGHRKIGYSSNAIENITSREERYQGYVQALLDNGIPVKSEFIHFRNLSCDPSRFNEYDVEQGEFISNNPQMTAVMCADDQVAISTLFTAMHMNIVVPEQLSIVGFSDTYLSTLTPIPLTTVRQDVNRLASAAVELLMKRVKQSKEHHLTIKIQTSIIERKSVFDRSHLL